MSETSNAINSAEKKLLQYFDTGYQSDDLLTIKEVFEELRCKMREIPL